MEMNWNKGMPVCGVEDAFVVSRSGAITVGFRIEKPEIYTLSGQAYTTLHQQWLQAVRGLPPKTYLHLQDYYWADSFQATATGAESWLGQASDRFFYERPWVRHEAYVFLTRPGEFKPSAGELIQRVLHGRLVSPALLAPATYSEFLSVCEQFAQILSEGGRLIVTRLGKSELWSTSTQAGLIERYCSLNEGTLPVLQDIRLKEELRVGDKYVQIHSFGESDAQPEHCADWRSFEPFGTPSTQIATGYASPLGLSVPFHHIYNQFVVIEDNSEVLRRLQSQRLRMQALAGLSARNALAAEAIGRFIEDAAGEQDPVVRSHFHVLSWSVDRKELGQQGKRIAAALSSMDIRPKLETVGAPALWLAGIPGNAAELPLFETQLSLGSRAICFFQHETQYRDSVSAPGLRLGDRLTGRPLVVDLDVEPKARGIISNYNAIVLSGSGGGKSFFTNHLVRANYEAGHHVLIIDIGGSYEVQCALHKGQYFACDEEHPIALNPFLPPSGSKMDADMRENIQALLVTLWKKEDDSYSRSEYAALSQALSLFAEKMEADGSVAPGFDSFYDFVNTEFRAQLEKERVKDKDFDLSNFLYVMKLFYRGGAYDYLLNAPTNIDLVNERFIVFELGHIRNHPILLPVTTLTVMFLFDSKIRRLPGVRKLVVIEEAWKAIARQGTAEYIRYLYKTLRKHAGQPVLVTQEIEDITQSEIIRQAVIANSDIRILLDQSKFQQKFKDIQELLGLTDQQKAEILSVNRGKEVGRHYKDVWIGLGASHSRVYRLEVSREEYYVYTSDSAEKKKVQEFIRRYGDVRRGIQALVAEEQKKSTS